MGPIKTATTARYGQDKLLAETVVLTRLDKAVGWARKYSLFPYPFALLNHFTLPDAIEPPHTQSPLKI